jgi:glycosyltransferase involved in cell wall biosynthesis
MNQLTISVVIPTLNSPWLDQTLAGLRRQTYNLDLVEVLVVGQDGCHPVAEDSMVRMIYTPQPQPPAVARNLGLEAATGDIVCFTDDDCVPDPTWLEMLANRYADSTVTVIGGSIDFPQHGYWIRCDALASAYEQLHFQPAGIRRQLPSMNFSARREVLLALGGFNTNYPFPSGEDAELCMRLRQRQHLLHFEPRAIVYHLGWRQTLVTVWTHIRRYGKFSAWINPELTDIVKPPFFFRHWLTMLAVSPLLAVWLSMRMYVRRPSLLTAWFLLPGLYLAQLAWCSGVIYSLRQRYSS